MPVAFCQKPPAPQDQPAPPAAPTALPTPAITGPLSNLPPATFEAGPFGKLAVNGILSGYGLLQNNHVPGDDTKQADLSNGQVFIQKTDGWFQFYLQAGAYNIPDLGLPFVSTKDTISDLYGPLPVAFLKLQAGKNTSILIGSLPTLIGAEYTFSFENMNVERGLLWNQENAINRGIQVNQTMGKFTRLAELERRFLFQPLLVADGFLSLYQWAPCLVVRGGWETWGRQPFRRCATPVQNNGSMYDVIYTYTKGPWIVQPYFNTPMCRPTRRSAS